MSFGFSIGDFLAVGKLIADIITSLQDAGGAKSDYQDLVRELECLGEVLRRLDKLQTRYSNTKSLESIKYAALSCQRPLEDFLGKIRRYEDTLGVRAKRSVFGKSSVQKIRWSLGTKEEVTKLQAYLSVHIGTINILLAEHGLESLQVASRDAEGFHIHVRGTLEDMQRAMSNIERSSGAQRHAVETNNSMLTELYQMVCGDISTGLKSIMGMASTVCVMTQQINGILVEIKSSFHVDTRWTWFQDPFKVEDALGVKFPIPAEYNFDLIEVITKTRFKNGPGSQEVQLGNYELVQARNSSRVISAESFLRPGTHIIMAIIINRHGDGVGTSVCPMRNCGSMETAPVPGGGRVCSECEVRFDESNRERKRAEDVMKQETGRRGCSPTESSSASPYRHDSKRLGNPSLPDEETRAYKNVRYSRPSSIPKKGNAPVNDKDHHEATMGLDDSGCNRDYEGISESFGDLNCDDYSVDTDEELRRRLERKKRRGSSRPFKRTHSWIVGNDTDDTGSEPRLLRRKLSGRRRETPPWKFEDRDEADNEEEHIIAPDKGGLQSLPFWVSRDDRMELGFLGSSGPPSVVSSITSRRIQHFGNSFAPSFRPLSVNHRNK